MLIYICLAVLLFYSIILNIQIISLKQKKHKKLFEDANSEEDVLSLIEDKIKKLEKDNKSAITKIGIYRFDIGDASGKQSFSIALLNEDNKGVVIRGLFTREASRVYCIKVDQDGTDKELQEEDIKALQNAIRQ